MTQSIKKVPFVNLGLQYQRFSDQINQQFIELSSSGQFVLGSVVEKFEQSFAQACDSRYAIGVANGTDALVLIMDALGIGPGDEVITAPNSFIASAGAIARVGARPVFVDIREDYNLDWERLEAAINSKTKAIMPVHLTGLPADMSPINDIATQHGIAVIEDAAQAFGAKYYGRPVGSLGTAAAFSLHPLKNLHVHGDGGVVTTDDPKIAKRIQNARNHGLVNRDECHLWGFNSRLDSIQAAIAQIKLDYYQELLGQILERVERYNRGLQNFEPAIKTPIVPEGSEGVFQNYIIRTELDRDGLAQFLSDRGIDSKVHYPIPIHLQKAAQGLGYQKGDFPVTERHSQQCLSLPIYPELDLEAVDWVIQSIGDFVEQENANG